MKFKDIKNTFKKDLKNIDIFMRKNLKSNINLIEDISNYIISYGGKRTRPLITILFSKIFKNDIDQTLEIASAIELIHTATLLHDDVVDKSEKRRGKISINKIWGNKEAILVGDFLYTRAFEIMVNLNNMQLLKHMANTTNIISEGEINQLINKNNFDIKEEDYFNIIKSKTAQLFASSAAVTTILNNNLNYFNNIFEYGINLGIAYQLIDDILDYTSEDEKFGKNTGDDILNGTFTLPLIYILKNNIEKKNIIKNIINTNDIKKIITIKNIVTHSDALIYTKNLAIEHIKKAKEAINFLDESKYKKMASSLLDFILERQY